MPTILWHIDLDMWDIYHIYAFSYLLCVIVYKKWSHALWHYECPPVVPYSLLGDTLGLISVFGVLHAHFLLDLFTSNALANKLG